MVTALGLLGAGGLLTANGVSAAGLPVTPPPGCTPSGSGYTCSTTYDYTGAEQTFDVPTGVSSVTATLVGAGGGAAGGEYHAAGGQGAVVTSTLRIPRGETSLYIEVGGVGFNGGGRGANDGGVDFGGGGGASDVRTTPATAATSLSTRIAIAAGGGGGGYGQYGGGQGGSAGADGQPIFPSNSTWAYQFRQNYDGSGGHAGTPTAGGAAGSAYGLTAKAGTLSKGGNGFSRGGGGGGGLYGGGGGAIYAGGGGGSSLGTVTGLTTAPASVVLSYSYPAALVPTTGVSAPPPVPTLPALPLSTPMPH